MKRDPVPLTKVRSDYEVALKLTLEKANLLAAVVGTLLTLNQIPEAVRDDVEQALNEFNRAFRGE